MCKFIHKFKIKQKKLFDNYFILFILGLSKGNKMTEIIKQDTSFLTLLDKALSKEDFNTDTLSKMLDMQERIMTKNAEMAFNNAMSEMQPKLPIIQKSKKAHNSNYAPYEEIEKQVRPIYTKYGFSIGYNSKSENGDITFYGTLSHKDGHSKTAEIQLKADTSGSKNDIQAMGSSVSYAKRYLLGMLLNVVTADDDNDGNSFEYINDAQIAELDRLIEETKSNEVGFLSTMKVDYMGEIKKSDYKKAFNLLNGKLAKNG